MFRDFKKYRVSAQNPKELAFGFPDKRLFTVKMGQKFVFHTRKVHIISWLDITVLYTIILKF
jgi:hypothetical protein